MSCCRMSGNATRYYMEDRFMSVFCETSRRWLTRREASEYLTLSPSQFDNLVRAGRIQIARVGRRILVDRLWLDDRLAAGGL